VKLILFEKSRVELEFVFSIFTTRVRKHLGTTTLFSPLRTRGPVERASLLLLTLHQGLAHTVRNIGNIAAMDASSFVSISLSSEPRSNGTTRKHVVHVNKGMLPPGIARALEQFIEQILISQDDQNIRPTTDEASHNSTPYPTHNSTSRHLLLFQELAFAVEKRVRSGWEEVDRLHEAFSQSVTQILTYKNVPQLQSASELQWGKATDSTFKRDQCDELHDLLMLLIRTTNGISLGWRTITHERDTLQSKPFGSLKEAWPQLIYVDDVHDNTDKETYRLDDYTYVKSADVLVNAAADIVNSSFVALDVKPSIFYNFFFSVVSAANFSVAPCQYESVQTCSQWRVLLLHGILICLFFFTVFAWVLNIFGFSFLIALLVPLFSIAIFQLCYGYTFRCLPM